MAVEQPAGFRRGPRVAHVVPDWLPLSQNWLHAQVSASHGGDTVFAGQVTAASSGAFSVSELVELAPPTRSPRSRVGARIRTAVAGSRSTTARRLDAALKGRPFELLHAHHGESGVNGLEASASSGIPLITSFYGRDQNWQAGYDDLFKTGDRFFVLGPEMARTLTALGAPADRVSVVPLSLDLAPFPFYDRSKTRSDVLVAIGRLVEKKGFDDALRAFSLATTEWPEGEFWIAGDGPLKVELQALAAELGIASKVRFLGSVSRADLPGVLGQASLAIQPSRLAADGDKEGSPTTIMELQAVGIPVVATRHADIPFVVPDPERLAEERDVEGLAKELLRRLNFSSTEYSDLARAGREKVVEQHEVSRVADRIAAFYSQEIEARR